jgi:hypothetical protein
MQTQTKWLKKRDYCFINVSYNYIFQPSTACENQVVKIAVPYIFLPDIDKHEDSYPLRCAFYTLLSNM